MGAEIVALNPGPRCAPDLPGILRDLADSIERGDVTGMVFAYIDRGDYITSNSASLSESLVLATLLQAAMLEKFRG